METLCAFQFDYIPAWINCYLFGMVIKKIMALKWRLNELIVCGVFCVMLALNGMQISIDYFKKIHFGGILESVYGELCHYGHVFMALGIFIAVMRTFSKMNMSNYVKNILNLSDKYSYDIFLVHPVFVWSGISPLRHISSPWMASVVLILEISISAYLLNRCAAFVRKHMSN